METSVAQTSGRPAPAGRQGAGKWIVLAVTALFIIGVIWFVVSAVQADRARSAEAAVEIVEVRKVSWTTQEEDTMEHHEGYDIAYRYRVDGQVYEGVHTRNEHYQPGAAMKVCYNPAHPADNRLRPAEARCGR